MSKLKIDLHDFYNNKKKIDNTIIETINFAAENRIKLVEIIPGKGSGQLKKHAIRLLQRKEIKCLYHRLDKDSKNFGRLFVRFKYS